MNIRHVFASTMAAALLAAPLAYSAPGAVVSPVVKFRSTSDAAIGSFSEDADNYSYFVAKVYDDEYGVLQGEMYVVWNDNAAYNTISCSGPGYTNVVAVNPKDGTTNIKATLNPGDPACWVINPTGAVTVSLTGKFDGTYRKWTNGTGKETQVINGTVYTYKFNTKTDEFGEIFTGTVQVPSRTYTTFTGRSTAERNNDRKRVQ
jgi:hypothetical protein